MVENALKYKFRKLGYKANEIKAFFTKFKGLSLVYAVDIEGITSDIHFNKIIVFNIADAGVLLPETTLNLLRELNYYNEPCIYKVPVESALAGDTYLVLFSHEDGLMPALDEGHKAHGLYSYTNGIIVAPPAILEVVALNLYTEDPERGVVGEILH